VAHVDATCGERQPDGEGQKNQYNWEILCLQLYAHSAPGPVAEKDMNILQILSDLPL
jgi:hypothetical protein